MSFPFSFLRAMLLLLIVITSVISLAFSVITIHDKTGGSFQVLTICSEILILLNVICCLCHQFATRNEEANNTRNLCLFAICGLLGVALAIVLTVHARQGGGMGTCNDFAHAKNSCMFAGVQLGMAYVSPVLALAGFVISWIDRFPGVVKVMPRYPITKAPSSHFAAYGHDLDEYYTHPPVKVLSRSRNNSEWSDMPLHC